MDERIKELRKVLKLTQQEFADRILVDRSTITGYETGKAIPGNAMISLICREFGVSRVWLLSGEGEMFVSLGRIAEITQRVAAMSGENNPFKEKLLLALLRLPPERWSLIEQAAREILSETEKGRDD